MPKLSGLYHSPRSLFPLFIALLMLSKGAVAAPPTFSAVFSPATVAPGNESTLIFTIATDSEAGAIIGGQFTNTLPTGLVFASPVNASSDCPDISLSAANGGTVLSATGIKMPESSVCSVSVKVKTDISLAGATYTNTSGAFTSDLGSSGTATAQLIVDDTLPRYNLSFTPDAITPGAVSRLTFEILNVPASGFNNWSGVINLSAGLEVASTPAVVTDCPNSTITANPNAGNISMNGTFVGSVVSCTVSVDVRPTLLGELNASMSSLAFGGFPSTDLGQASAILNVTPVFASLEFDPLIVAPGGTTSLIVTMTNRDRVDALTDIAFSDNLDAALSGLVATGLPLNDICGTGSSISGASNLTFSGGSLAPEASCNFSIPISIPPGASPGSYTNTTSALTMNRAGAPVIGEQVNDPVSNELRVSATPVLVMDFADAVIASGGSAVINYSITNANLTNQVSDIAFSHNLGATFSGATVTGLPTGGYCGAGSIATANVVLDEVVLNVSGGVLAAGASCSFSITLNIPAGTLGTDYITTTGDISATVGSATISGPGASDSITVAEGPLLTLELPQTAVTPGDQVTATFTLSKDSLASSISGISFSLNLENALPGLTVDSITFPASLAEVCGAGSTVSADINQEVITFSGGILDVTDSCTFDAVLTVPATAISGSYTLTISDLASTVLGVPVSGPVVSNDLEVTNLVANISFVENPVEPGGTSTLRFSFQNTSAQALTGMFLTMDLDDIIPGMVATGLPINDICGVGSSLTGTNFLIFTGGNLAALATCIFDVPVSIPANAALDTYRATTSNLSFTESSTVIISSLTALLTVENDAPSVVITSALSPATSVTPIPVTISFDEDVTGFTIGDLTASVTNGTLENFVKVSDSVYTVNIRPVSDGSVTLQVPANSAQDLAPIPNGNTASNVFDIQYTEAVFVLPSITIGPPDQVSTSTGPVSYLITYSNATEVNLDAAEVNVVSTGDAAAASISVAGGVTNTPIVTLSDITGSGTLAISLAAETARNDVGPAPATSESIPFEVIFNQPDDDGDGVVNSADNCTQKANPGQEDSDNDGYGNLCDGDLNNDLFVNVLDLWLFIKAYFFTQNPAADFNSDGAVDLSDLVLMKSMFFRPPGPSGIAP